MKSETYNIGDVVKYQNIIWEVEKDLDLQVFIRSGKLTAWIFKSNRDLKLYNHE